MIIKQHRGILIFFFLFLLFSSGCEEKNEKTSLIVSPLNLYIPAQSLEVVSLEVSCNSEIDLSNFKITSQIQGKFSQTEFDSVISGNVFSYRFEYSVPLLLENTTILLEFAIEDIQSNLYRNARMLEVTAAELLLAESTGHEFYSKYSGKENAYNLIEGESIFFNSLDYMHAHIADTSVSNRLERVWISPAGLSFIRYNDFDYANCTNISIRSAFLSGNQKQFIDELQQGDIIMMRQEGEGENELFFVVKITGLYDETGSDYDRYIFNLKK
ncbi:MAG: hypothetical protein KAS71_00050 [Bacteroidales bacterium]|nr:hypothetical protein [Bacteroidales bacterium]